MAIDPRAAHAFNRIQEKERRRLDALREIAAQKGIDTPPEIRIEIEDLESKLGIFDLIQGSGDTWTGSQVQVLVLTMTTANQERWGRIDRRMEGVEEAVQSLIFSHRVQLVIGAALIILVLLQTWGK